MVTTEQHKNQKVNWVSVVTYYVLACAFSWPFFWWRDMESASWQASKIPGFLRNLAIMWGPGLSALICFALFRKTHHRTITFFGNSIVKSLLFWFVPIIALSVFVLKGEDRFILPFAGFLMILGEELGWRGFLQDALRPLPQIKRYILIGVMWELWHFTNRIRGFDLKTILRVGAVMTITILLSFIIGKLTDKTKALVVAVTLHGWVDILFEYSSPATNIIFGCSVVFWGVMVWKWDPIVTKNNPL